LEYTFLDDGNPPSDFVSIKDFTADQHGADFAGLADLERNLRVLDDPLEIFVRHCNRAALFRHSPEGLIRLAIMKINARFTPDS
jgi:hypothetical protein